MKWEIKLFNYKNIVKITMSIFLNNYIDQNLQDIYIQESFLHKNPKWKNGVTNFQEELLSTEGK